MTTLTSSLIKKKTTTETWMINAEPTPEIATTSFVVAKAETPAAESVTPLPPPPPPPPQQLSTTPPSAPIPPRRTLSAPSASMLDSTLYAAALATAVCGSVCVYAMIFSLAPKMIRDFGFEEDDVARNAGILMGSYHMGAMVTSVLWGLASDRFGQRCILVLSLLLIGTACMGFGASSSLKAALAWRVTIGALDGVMSGVRVQTADAANNAATHARNVAIVFAGSTLGLFLGPFIAGFVADDQRLPTPGFPCISGFPSAVCLFGVVLVLAFVDQIPMGKDKSKQKSRDKKQEEKQKEKQEEKKGKKRECLVGEASSLIQSTDDDDDDDDDDGNIDEVEKDKDDKRRDSILRGNDVDDPDEEEDDRDEEDSKCSFVNLLLFLLLNAIFSFAFIGVRDAVVLWAGVASTHGGLGMTTASLGILSGVANLPGVVVGVFVVPRVAAGIGLRRSAVFWMIGAAVFALLLPTTKLLAESTSVPPMTLVDVTAHQNSSRINATQLYQTNRLINESSSLDAAIPPNSLNLPSPSNLRYQFFLIPLHCLQITCAGAAWQSLAALLNERSPSGRLGIVNGAALTTSLAARALGPVAAGSVISAALGIGVGDEIRRYGLVFFIFSLLYVFVAGAMAVLP